MIRKKKRKKKRGGAEMGGTVEAEVCVHRFMRQNGSSQNSDNRQPTTKTKGYKKEKREKKGREKGSGTGQSVKCTSIDLQR